MTDLLRACPRPTLDRAAEGAAAEIGELPVWNLADLYPGTDSPELNRDLEEAGKRAAAFRKQYHDKLAKLGGDALADAIAEYEAISETLGRIMSFASLAYAANVSDAETGRFYQGMQERVNNISAHTLFFTLEINQIEDAALEKKVASSEKLARYRPWLRDTRVFRPHQLPDEIERLLHDQAVAGTNAWIRLFDETIANLRFEIDGKPVTESEALNRLSDPDRGKREAAAHEISRVFGRNIRLFAHITNTLAKSKEVMDKWRNYPRPVSAMNRANFVEDEVVDALVDAVKAAYPDIAHRYYSMKAGWLGLDKLQYWDRNAPLPDAEDRTIPWNEAKETVLSAYGRFSPALAEVGTTFFDRSWIDAQVREGKASGAFSHPTVPSAHPYILMSYQGRTRDVMTLAHELGHGVHQVLAGEQGYLMADTPLTLAETASVFGEMMTFRSMLDAESDKERRRTMLSAKIEDMINTVVRQIAFYEFERQVHDQRREGELLPEQIGEIWLGVQKESLGPAFEFNEGYRHYWAYIPHFIHSPFYVYAYAFGDCLVNSLYAVYEQNPDGFEAKYIEMLKAGGTLRHKELLAPFGLDAGDPEFWDRGLGVIRGLIDELAAME